MKTVHWNFQRLNKCKYSDLLHCDKPEILMAGTYVTFCCLLEWIEVLECKSTQADLSICPHALLQSSVCHSWLRTYLFCAHIFLLIKSMVSSPHTDDNQLNILGTGQYYMTKLERAVFIFKLRGWVQITDVGDVKGMV